MYVFVSRGTHAELAPRRERFAAAVQRALGRRPEAWSFANGDPSGHRNAYPLGHFADTEVYAQVQAAAATRPAFVIVETEGLPTGNEESRLLQFVRRIAELPNGGLLVVVPFAPWDDREIAVEASAADALRRHVAALGEEHLSMVTFFGTSNGQRATGIIETALGSLERGMTIGHVVDQLHRAREGQGAPMIDFAGKNHYATPLVHERPVVPLRSGS